MTTLVFDTKRVNAAVKVAIMRDYKGLRPETVKLLEADLARLVNGMTSDERGEYEKRIAN